MWDVMYPSVSAAYKGFEMAVLAISLVVKILGWINSVLRVPKKLSATVLSQQSPLHATGYTSTV